MRKKGFTLIEFIIVLLIIGLLVSIGALQYDLSIENSKKVTFKSAILNALSAAESRLPRVTDKSTGNIQALPHSICCSTILLILRQNLSTRILHNHCKLPQTEVLMQVASWDIFITMSSQTGR